MKRIKFKLTSSKSLLINLNFFKKKTIWVNKNLNLIVLSFVSQRNPRDHNPFKREWESWFEVTGVSSIESIYQYETKNRGFPVMNLEA